jgi:hypothetical protein
VEEDASLLIRALNDAQRRTARTEEGKEVGGLWESEEVSMVMKESTAGARRRGPGNSENVTTRKAGNDVADEDE